MMLEGQRVTGNRPAEVRHPEELLHGEDYWIEYRVDLITIRSLSDWRVFRKKWFQWLDEETLGLTMTEEKLQELQTKLRMIYHEKVYPDRVDRWLLKLWQPQIFVTTEMVRVVSSKTDQLPNWSDTFFWICSLGFIKSDEEGRLFVDEEKLAPDAGERLLGHSEGLGFHLENAYQTIRNQSLTHLPYTPPDWEGAVENALKETHQPSKIIIH